MWNLIKSLLDSKRFIDIILSELPSRGIFYPNDLEIKIKSSDQKDIDNYNSMYVDNDFISIFASVKRIVKNNTKLSKDYTFNNIVSIDILYLFLQIVKKTKGKDIYLDTTKHGKVKFSPDNFNYFKLDKYLKYFNYETREFIYNDFKYSLPTVGAETCVSKFMYDMWSNNRLSEFSEASYDFLYFLGGRTYLSNDEIENLVSIFNDEMPDTDKKAIETIVKRFKPLSKYSLKVNNTIVPLENIDLKLIWNI